MECTISGEFLEIVPNQKIAFTWCQDYETNPIPDTKVFVELQDLGGKTNVTIVHTGFNDLENCDNHKGGWTAGITDLNHEMVDGKLNMSRKIKMSVEKLFAACQAKVKGDRLDATQNEKLIFKIDGTQANLSFEADDEAGASWVNIIHEGLNTEAQQKAQRAYWNTPR